MNKYLINITILLTFFLFGYIVYSLFYPFNPLEMQEPVEVLNKKVKPGEMVLVNFNFKKNTKIIPDVSLSLVDGVVYIIPDYRPINPPGVVSDRIVGVMTVPMSIPCGEYLLKWVASYKYNAIRTVEVQYQSEKFYIDSELCGGVNGEK